jgi:cytoskeleton protein RodZ
MVHSQLIEESEVQQLVSRGPGEVLKQARMRADIALQEVSEYLHLSVNMIQAIEADDQERLPEPAYVKGYIRSYARYLELDHEPLIESYVKYIQPEPRPFLAPETKKKGPASEPRRGILNLIVIVILSIILVFLVIWWFYPQPTKFMGRLQSLLFGGSGEQIEVVVSTPPITENASVGGKNTEAVVPAPTQSAETDGEQVTQPFSSVEVSPAAQDPNTPSSTEQLRDIQKVHAAMAEGQSEGFEMQGRQAPGVDRLTLTFTENSWAEVYDANKERLLFGLMNAGSVKDLNGTAPFRVLLGNSTSAKILYNDQPFNHSQFERWDKTARFNVGEPKTN